MTRMQTSSHGDALIKRFEGLELEAYLDAAGIWTLGYGHTGAYPDWLRFPAHRLVDRVGPGHAITEEEAERLLADDLKPREDALNGWMINEGVALNQNEFDALISFIFNLGFAAFKGSTAARWLREGKPREKVAEALTWWNKATVNGKLVELRGLTRRRAAEKALFLTPANDNVAADYVRAFVGVVSEITDHKESNCAPAKEQRPLLTYLPNWSVAA